jgi:hypothetical protein
MSGHPRRVPDEKALDHRVNPVDKRRTICRKTGRSPSVPVFQGTGMQSQDHRIVNLFNSSSGHLVISRSS